MLGYVREAQGTSRWHRVVDSPIGALTLVWDPGAGGSGALCGVHVHDQRLRPPDPVFGDLDEGAAGPLEEVRVQLRDYFDGDRREFDVPVALDGTDFQRAVWTALREVGYGDVTSYGELARHIGRPAAARAVGAANGRNPVSILVPCHRVVGADGRVAGDDEGVRRKHRLRVLEGSATTRLEGSATACGRSAQASDTTRDTP